MDKVISPCISICKTDPSTGLCYGCGRSIEEKSIWRQENTSNEWKLDNLILLKSRLTGWQLTSFDSSFFLWSASIMRKRGNIFDVINNETDIL